MKKILLIIVILLLIGHTVFSFIQYEDFQKSAPKVSKEDCAKITNPPGLSPPPSASCYFQVRQNSKRNFWYFFLKKSMYAKEENGPI